MKKRGRPRLDPQDGSASVSLHVRVPAKQFDATYARATAARVTMAEWVRRQLGERPKA